MEKKIDIWKKRLVISQVSQKIGGGIWESWEQEQVRKDSGELNVKGEKVRGARRREGGSGGNEKECENEGP